MMMLTQKQLEAIAEAAGYSDYWEGYVMDKDLAKCEDCGKWGIFGEDVVGDGIDNYCEACGDKHEGMSLNELIWGNYDSADVPPGI